MSEVKSETDAVEAALSGGKVFFIREERYADYMAYLQGVFAVTDEAAAEKDPEKAKILLQAMVPSLFALEQRYNDAKLKRCVVGGDLAGLTVSESRELLNAIDKLSKPGIEEKN